MFSWLIRFFGFLWLQLGCYYSATQFIFFQQFPLLARVLHCFQRLPYLFTNLLWVFDWKYSHLEVTGYSIVLYLKASFPSSLLFRLLPVSLWCTVMDCLHIFLQWSAIINKSFPPCVLSTFQNSYIPTPVLVVWGPSELALVGTGLGSEPEIISKYITVLTRWTEVVAAGLHHLKFRVSIFRIENV